MNPAPPSAVEQVTAMIALRTSELRGRARTRAGIAAVLLPCLTLGCVAAGPLLPRGAPEAWLLAPQAWTLFALTATLGAVTGLGDRQLLPRAQAVVFPVSPAAEQLAAVLTMPLNLPWLVQAVGLLSLTTWGAGTGPTLPTGLLRACAWIVTVTVVAQPLGGLVDLARTSRAALALLRAGAVVAAGVAVAVVAAGRAPAMLDSAPARWVSRDAPTASVLGVLIVISLVAWWAGVVLVGVLMRRPEPLQRRNEARAHRLRGPSSSVFTACLRVDRAGVWRSAPLRRAALWLGVVPGVTGSLSGLSWQLGVLLPGLVSSGAALLFGVNALALDGAGALWRDSLPCPPRTVLLARILVVAEVCAASTLVALVAAAARSAAMPTPAEFAATAGALIACTTQVVGMCARWSVLRPYPAALRGSRDQPAPPGAMAWYSARLAVSTTGTGLMFVLLARSGSVTAVTSATLAVGLFAARRLMGLVRMWDDPAVRSRALVTVVATTA